MSSDLICLTIECDGICGTIDEYTDDSKVMNYLSKLQEAVAEANYDTIMYTLSVRMTLMFLQWEA